MEGKREEKSGAYGLYVRSFNDRVTHQFGPAVGYERSLLTAKRHLLYAAGMMAALLQLIRVPRQSMSISVGLLALRVVVGAAMALHGWVKVQHLTSWGDADLRLPPVLQAAAALSEFAGGIALVVGFLTPLACLAIGCTMAVAVCVHIFQLKQSFVSISMKDPGSYELPAVYFVAVLCLFLAGPGQLSLDRLVWGQQQEKTKV